MKKSVKYLSLVFALILVFWTFSGCKSNKINNALITKGTLTVGTNAEFAPFEYYEGDQIVGIDAEIVQAIAKKLNLEIKIVHMDFDALPNALSSNSIDCIAAGFSANATREESMDFSKSYYNATQSIIVADNSTIATKEDLALGMLNLVYESVGMLAIFAARSCKTKDIVLTGNLTTVPESIPIFESLSAMFNMNFIIPVNAQFGTVIGAALSYLK